MYAINKYNKQKKPTSTFEFIKRLEPINIFKIDVKGDTINRYEPEKSFL